MGALPGTAAAKPVKLQGLWDVVSTLELKGKWTEAFC